MAICPECNSVVPTGIRFCTNCGGRVDVDVKVGYTDRTKRPPSENERNVVQSSRAEQRLRIQPIDEKRPLPYDRDQPKSPTPLQTDARRNYSDYLAPESDLAENNLMSRERHQARDSQKKPPQEDSGLFDDDKFYQDKKPKRPVRETEEDWQQTAAAQTRPAPKSRPSQIHVLKTGECLLSMLLAIIPIVGIVMGMLWARSSTNPNRRNLSIAMVVFNAAEIVLGGIAFVLFTFVL